MDLNVTALLTFLRGLIRLIAGTREARVRRLASKIEDALSSREEFGTPPPTKEDIENDFGTLAAGFWSTALINLALQNLIDDGRIAERDGVYRLRLPNPVRQLIPSPLKKSSDDPSIIVFHWIADNEFDKRLYLPAFPKFGGLNVESKEHHWSDALSEYKSCAKDLDSNELHVFQLGCGWFSHISSARSIDLNPVGPSTPRGILARQVIGRVDLLPFTEAGRLLAVPWFLDIRSLLLRRDKIPDFLGDEPLSVISSSGVMQDLRVCVPTGFTNMVGHYLEEIGTSVSRGFADIGSIAAGELRGAIEIYFQTCMDNGTYPADDWTQNEHKFHSGADFEATYSSTQQATRLRERHGGVLSGYLGEYRVAPVTSNRRTSRFRGGSILTGLAREGVRAQAAVDFVWYLSREETLVQGFDLENAGHFLRGLRVPASESLRGQWIQKVARYSRDLPHVVERAIAEVRSSRLPLMTTDRTSERLRDLSTRCIATFPGVGIDSSKRDFMASWLHSNASGVSQPLPITLEWISSVTASDPRSVSDELREWLAKNHYSHDVASGCRALTQELLNRYPNRIEDEMRRYFSAAMESLGNGDLTRAITLWPHALS